jgi:uncharacterized alkaline shock family protein YloU
VPTNPTPGRSLVTRRAVVDVVRAATLGSYGVTGFAGGWIGRLQERLGLGRPGVAVTLGPPTTEPGARPDLTIDLDLTVAYGLPIAEVARQVDSAVRYALRKALGREVRRLTIHIDGLRFGPGGGPPSVLRVDPGAVGQRDLADSGTDVA